MIIYKNNKKACVGVLFSLIAILSVCISSGSVYERRTKIYAFPETVITGKIPSIQYYDFPAKVISVTNKGI